MHPPILAMSVVVSHVQVGWGHDLVTACPEITDESIACFVEAGGGRSLRTLSICMHVSFLIEFILGYVFL